MGLRLGDEGNGCSSRKRKMYPNIKHFIKENLYEIKLPKPETVVKGGKIILEIN